MWTECVLCGKGIEADDDYVHYGDEYDEEEDEYYKVYAHRECFEIEGRNVKALLHHLRS